MSNEQIIRMVLDNEVKAGKRKFVIVPFGKMGRIVQKELREKYQILEECCIDNCGIDGTVTMEEVKWENISNCDFLLVTKCKDIRNDLERELIKHVPKECIIDVFGYKDVSTESKFADVKLDFLCAGFHKCGTTSLDFALKKNRFIYTPKEKETLYLKWYDKYPNSAEMFAERYPKNMCEGKKIGGIEPSYYENASEIAECFGKDLKLIFMVRNPFIATYSFFKMQMREANTEKNIEYFKRFGTVSAKMFDAWVSDNPYFYAEYKYMDYIEVFLKYYPKEQIKVILLEELLENTEEVMDEVQRFIGLEDGKVERYESIPHENVGTLVCKDYASALINNVINKLAYEVREESVELMEEIKKRKDVLRSILHVEYKEQMLKETEDKLRDYFDESIIRLEKFIGKKTMW